MKKFIIFTLIGLLAAAPAFAFLYEVDILTKQEISRLTDKQLEEKYIEARIEERASQEFHISAGFSSGKDYAKRKNLMRYIFDLRREIAEREQIDADNLDQYLE